MAKFIQSIGLKKGSLRKQLGIKEGNTIPISVLKRIISTEIGKKVKIDSKTLEVTTKLKRRAILALRFKTGDLSRTKK